MKKVALKLIDVLKTENGRSFLGDHKGVITTGHDRLSQVVKGYNPEEEYEECEFSYKDHVRKMKKFEYGYSNIWQVMQEILKGKGKNKQIANFYCARVFDFDGDYIDIERTGEISFMPYNKIQKFLNAQYKYDPKGRQKVSAFKFFKKIIPSNIANEEEIQSFTEVVIGMVTTEFRVEFVSGQAVADMYHNIKMDGDVPWAKSSCMRGTAKTRFKMYVDNPKVCELGVIYEKDEPVGRFVRWNTKELGWVEDTLYYKTPFVRSWYEDRCANDNTIWKRVNAQNFVKADEKTPYQNRLSVELVKPFAQYSEGERPYLDTMRNRGEGNDVTNGANP